MSIEIKPLREELAALHSAGESLVAKVSSEKRDFTAEEKVESDKQFARMTEIKSVLDKQAKLAEFAFNEKSDRIELPSEPAGRKERDSVEIKITDRFDSKNIDRQEFNQSFKNWALTGTMDRRFATITTSTQSGVFLPKGVLQPLTPTAINAFREGYAAWGIDVMDTEGDTSQFSLPVINAVAGGLVAENASSEADGTPTLSKSILSTVATYQSGSVYFSNLQLSATKFDLLGATVPVLGYGKELGLEAAMVATIVGDSNITQSVATATVSGFTFANFSSLDTVLPKAFQHLKVLALGKAAYAAAEGLVDSYGRPVMIADTQNQNLRKILGVPVVRSDSFAGFGANNIVGAIISLVGFHFRDAGTLVTRYDQVPAKPNQVGINMFGYHAYGYTPDAIAYLKCPAS